MTYSKKIAKKREKGEGEKKNKIIKSKIKTQKAKNIAQRNHNIPILHACKKKKNASHQREHAT